jgi:hypothetical protein
MCILYRSRNGFGGYSNGVAEYKGTKLDPDMNEKWGMCHGVKGISDKAAKNGWADITDDYFKAAQVPKP